MRFFKICFFIFIFNYLFAANELQPFSSIETENNVISSAVSGNNLYVTTDKGTVEIFDLTENKNIKTIALEPIKAGFSDILIPPRISHIDIYNNGEKLLTISDDTHAGKALHIYEDGSFKKIFSTEDGLNISKAYFLDKNLILIGLLGNEIILYDLDKKASLYRVQPYWSMLTDYVLNEDKTLSYVAAESGIVYTLNTKDGTPHKNYDLHIDIILNVATQKDIMLTGGADRKLFVYNLKDDSKYFFASDFLVYAVGLSPDAKLGAYVANENNDINVFNTATKNLVSVLKGSERFININKIIFFNENEILVSYNNKKILIWKLK